MSEDVNVIGWITLVLVVSESYLRANKLWSRKHMQDVAESVSLMAQGVSLLTLGFYATASYIDGSLHGMVSSMIWFSMTVLMILVGTGLWLKNTRDMTPWERFKKFISKESQEVGDLVKDLYAPAGKNYLIKIVQKIALIDNQITDSEKEILTKVFNEWDEELNVELLLKTNNENIGNSAMEIQDLIESYLYISPPTEQVSRLIDLIKLLVRSDGAITHEEKLVSEEVLHHLQSYVAENANTTYYDVAIIPQKDEQRDSIQQLFPQLKHVRESHGDIYLNERFFTTAMANVYCEKYKDLGLNAVVIVRS